MKLYRGYNSQYNNYGIPSGSNHIWTTDDINYANEYYDSVVEFEINENELNVADIYDLWEVLGDEEGEFDPIDLDNEEAQALIDNNYNCLIFDTPSDETVYVLLDKKLIKSVRNIDKQDNYNDTINEVLRIAGVTQINESWTDDSDLYDIYEDYQPYNILEKFEYNKNENIWFPLIKPTEYKQALTEFMKMGEIVRFPENKIKKWIEIIFKNTMILDSMTALARHTQWFPYEECRNAYPELENVSEDDFSIFSEFLDKKGFYDWCKLPDGSDAWSDYGISPLLKILDEYQPNMSASQMLVLVNRCLDVWHQRGDLASAFIEGGSQSLTQISNECLNVKGNIINESYLKTDNGIIYYTKSENVFINTINARFKNIPVRVIYDLKNRLYVFGDANKFVHTQMMNYILVNTKLYSTKGWNQSYFNEDGNYWRDGYIEDNLFKLQCALFQIIWDNDIEKYTRYDGYDTGYFTTIDNKMYVVCRENELKYCEKVPLLWNNHWFSQKYDNMKDFQLNEEIVHSEMAIDPEFGDEYMKIILKNPTRQELYKEGMTFCRVLEDNKGNFYFADAVLYVHWEMEEELSSYGAYSQEMFYDYHKNLFMQRQDEYEDKNLLAKEAEETEKSLRNNPYISSTFGNFKYEAIFGEPLGY